MACRDRYISGSRVRVPRAVPLVIVAMAFAVNAMCALSASADAAECSNEQIRVAQGTTGLANCRAYELVTPPDATASASSIIPDGAQASASGNKLEWFSREPIESSPGNFYNIASRNENGWRSESVLPGQSTSQAPIVDCGGGALFSTELDSGIWSVGEKSDGLEGGGAGSTPNAYCGSNVPELVPDEPRGFQNLFLLSLDHPNRYQLVNETPTGVPSRNATLEDVTPNLEHVVFAEDAPLTERALGANNLYEWSQGQLQLVSVLPSGAPVEALLVGYSGKNGIVAVTSGTAMLKHAVSTDGSRVIFTAEGKLFMRLHADAPASATALDAAECVASELACTIWLDESQAGGPGGGGKFLAATTNGSSVFFTDEPGAELTGDTEARSGENLYEYEVATGQLTDLTPVAKADVLGFSGIGEEGSSVNVYFAAEGALASGAVAKEPNLYVYGNSEIKLVAALEKNGAAEEDQDWLPPEGEDIWEAVYLKANTSPNGQYFAFSSSRDLTGYDNIDAATKTAQQEIFVYEAVDGNLSCASCDPSGVGAAGSSTIDASDVLLVGMYGPAGQPHSVLDDGQVFLRSPNDLTGAGEGVNEVYEYQHGHVSLISSGTSSEGSYFDEATANGENVFFATTQSLVPSDTNRGLSIYDARVDGGFAAAGQAMQTPACESEEACRPSLSEAPPETFGASAAFDGPGDLLPPETRLQEASHGAKHGATKLTRGQKLQRALKKCRKKTSKKRRSACEAKAHKQFGGKDARKRGAPHRQARRAHHRSTNGMRP